MRQGIVGGLGALGALLTLLAAVAVMPSAAVGERGVVREYWVAAVPMRWDVVPNGRNAIEGERFSKSETRFTTIVYRRYTRDWERAVPNQPGAAADNDGIPGPLLRARVGDKIP